MFLACSIISKNIVGNGKASNASLSSKGFHIGQAPSQKGRGPKSCTGDTTFAIRFIGYLLLELFIAVFPLERHGWGDQIQLLWDDNREASVVGYRIYYGNASRTYPWSEEVDRGSSCDAAGTCSSTLELPSGHWFIALTAFDTNGLESSYSNEVDIQLDDRKDVQVLGETSNIILGCNYDIVWAGLDGKTVRIYLIQNEQVIRTIKRSTRNDGVHRWKVSRRYPTGEGFGIRISNGHGCLSSAETFGIFAPRVIWPASGTAVSRGSSVAIRWAPETLCGPSVRITLFRGKRAVMTIAKKAPNQGIFLWQVPSNLRPKRTYRIRVRCVSAPACKGFSEGYFQVH